MSPSMFVVKVGMCQDGVCADVKTAVKAVWP